MPRVVQVSPELIRVRSLPRRNWLESAEELAAHLDQSLGRGTQRLRPIQAAALYDAWTNRGLFAPIRVGGGKTLISFLVVLVLHAKRPLLLLPASLIEKTRREQLELSRHWKIPNYVNVQSYEYLGQVNQVDWLERFRPDLIIADEVHWLKNRTAARTKRVGRYMRAHPETMFVALSGTITKRSLKDYHHIIQWCLKANGAPVPAQWGELENWADALDEHDRERPDLGALLTLADQEDLYKLPELTAARRGFQRRLTETPGVVISTSADDVDCSLRISPIMFDAKTDAEFTKLRREWETPDGWELIDAMAVWAVARQLALGFYYRWEPRPPSWWYEPRREWAKMCRAILGDNNRRLDSEKAVVMAIDRGHYPMATPILEHWRAVKDHFEPNSVAEWIDRSLLEVCAEWSDKGGIIWVEHVEFGRALAKHACLEYYGQHGLTDTGRFIQDHNPVKPCIAGIHSNKEGRNLQGLFSRNLLASPPPGTGLGIDTFEQLLGRTHRPGQTEDEVIADVILGCREHWQGFWGAYSAAQYVRDSTGQEQKLLIADITIPTEPPGRGIKWE